jgi:hypothetical protein
VTLPHAFNLDWVTPALAVGGCYPMEEAARLARELGIRRVVDVRVEECDDEAVLRSHGITLLHLPTTDTRAVSLPMIRDGVRWVNTQLDAGEKVLVHCQHGVGRSALLALCVLVSRGDDPVEALRRAKAARRVVSPSPEQLLRFIDFCNQWKRERGAPWEPPSLEDLGRIAWAHLSAPSEGRP